MAEPERRPTIALCMIVKDEAANLPRCLASVQGAVDEIVVADTGSTDGTQAIAARYGARVLDVGWRGDFAAARNASLEAASGDWILFLDGDEALGEGDGAKLRELALHGEYEGFFLQIHNYVGNGSQGATINPVLRMFRNRPEHRFEGRIHEQIAGPIMRSRPGAAFHISDAVIRHYGYEREQVVRKDKVNRNVALLRAALAEEPDNAFYHYNIGVEYLRSGRPAEALDAFLEAERRIDPLAVSYAHLLCKYEIRCRQALGHWEDALGRANEALALFPEYTDLLHYRAVCETSLGRRAEARRSLAAAMSQGPPPAMYHTEEGIGGYQSAYALALLNEEDGDAEEALLWHLEALRGKPSLDPPLYRSFRLLRLAGREKEIGAWMRENLAVREPGALRRMIVAALHGRCGEAALALLRLPLARKLPDGFRVLAEGAARLLLGETAGALRLLEREGGRTRDGADERRIDGLREQLQWLAGDAREWRDPLVRLLESGAGNAGTWPAAAGEGGGKAAEGVARDAAAVAVRDTVAGERWAELQRLLEAASASGNRAAFGYILSRWLAWQRAGARLEGDWPEEAGESAGHGGEGEHDDATGSRAASGEGREAAAGAAALARSLAAVADRHLHALAARSREAAGGDACAAARGRSLFAARLRLPGEDGF